MTPELWVVFQALALLLAMGAATWLASLPLRDVSIVDSVWPLLLAAAGALYALRLAPRPPGPRTLVVLALLAAWALRLCLYITVRNAGHGEDRRYQAIRRRNDPGFAVKSLYLVFALQAVLAWVLSFVLLAALRSAAPWSWLDAAGALLAAVGLAWESIGDWQLSRFKRDPARRGQVMDRGLWRYSRHPNYFGESCFWWGLWLLALAAGGAWSVVSPLMITFMLLKVSGVALLESDLRERSAGYRDYIARTNAFLPWRPR